MRVLVVRGPRQSEATAHRLRARGHDPILAPVVEIVPTGAVPPDLSPDALLLTSANAAPAAFAWRDRLGAVPVFAVGDRSAGALAEAGFSRVLSADGDAAALARLVARELAPGAALLHLCGRDGKAEPQRSLEAAGFEVLRWVVYEARAAAALPREACEALESGRLDAALHYSRRSAKIAAALARAAGCGPIFAALAHICLSEDVAAGLGEPAPERLAVAGAPTEDAALAALDCVAAAAASRRARAAGGRDAREGTGGTNRPLRIAEDKRTDE